MNEVSKKDKVLTVQVVSEALETLPSIGRIVVAARYLDGYGNDKISDLFEMSEEVVCKELRRAMTYLWVQCLDYEKLNRCKLKSIDEEILRESFMLLLKHYKYHMTRGVAVTLYNLVCDAICS